MSKNDGMYTEEVLAALSEHNLENPDVMNLFLLTMRMRDFGLKKVYLPDWNQKRRRYDNAILILEATRFIKRIGSGASTKYFPTTEGLQLAVYLVNSEKISVEDIEKMTEEEFVQFVEQNRKRNRRRKK